MSVDLDKEFKDCQSRADKGDVKSLRNLGDYYYFGKGVQQDYKKAFECYQLSSASYDLGWCYYNGEGVAKDYKKAFECYQSSADEGNTMSLCELGNFYYFGQGVEQDYKKAFEYYQSSFDKGHIDASYDLGWQYYYGYGVEQDRVKACEYFQLSFDNGITDAITKLSDLYQNGTTQDYNKATKMYKKAIQLSTDSNQIDGYEMSLLDVFCESITRTDYVYAYSLHTKHKYRNDIYLKKLIELEYSIIITCVPKDLQQIIISYLL